jgi:hypothetical protein
VQEALLLLGFVFVVMGITILAVQAERRGYFLTPVQ